MATYRSETIPPFIVMEILERAQELERQGRSIIHMEIGEPDFDTPAKIKQAAIDAINRNETHYTHSLGIKPLREAIVQHYKSKYNVEIESDQVIVTQGTSPGLLLILCALLETGDEAIITNPCYACYPNFINYIGGVPIDVPLSAENGFILTANAAREKISAKTRAILINSPSNPTGTLLPANHMQEIANLGPTIISDEIYHGLVYGEKEHSILEYTDNAFVLNGFSKYYAMTGWRLGYIIAPKAFVRPIQKSQQNLFICASSVSQWAGVAALTQEHPELFKMLNTCNERRLYLIKALKELGFKLAVEPSGAFYMLADARHLSDNSYDLALDMLDKTGVAVDPGIDFGEHAEGFLRFSYANSLENIKQAMVRLEQYIKP